MDDLDHNQAIEGSKATRFQRGTGGNRKGRRRGSRNAKTLLVDGIMSERAVEVAKKAVELALEGNAVALRLCLERIAPARKDRPINFALPALDSAADAKQAVSAIV